MSHIDKLALISKLILDERVLELRREIEALRLELFCRDHNIGRLTALMREANRCECCQCEFVGIYCPTIPRVTTLVQTCIFDDWFHSLIVSCGMTVGELQDNQSSVDFHMSHAYNLDGQRVYDVDAHFYQRHEIFSFWKYGSKLWKAKSVNDPELQKLKRLFERLKTSNGRI